MKTARKDFHVVRPRMPGFQLVLKHVAFEGEGVDALGRPPVAVSLSLGKRTLECVKVEREGKVRFRKFFRTGKGFKWIKAVASWADGSETVVTRFLVVNFASKAPNPFVRNYRHFIERNGPKPVDLAVLEGTVQKLPVRPKISVIMPTYNTDPRLLREAVESVKQQIYPEWELCIADDASTSKATRKTLQKLESSDSRIKVCYRPENGHISKASNSALEIATGEWVALLDHDDLLTPQSLARVVLEMNRHPEARFIYSDEDKVDVRGHPVAPYFKPDWNPLFLCSQNYICHLSCIRREDLDAVGGFRVGFEGSQDWDLFLRLGNYLPEGAIRHIPEVLYHWRIIPGSSAANVGEKSYSVQASRKAIEEAVRWREGGRWDLIANMYWVCSPTPSEEFRIISIADRGDGIWSPTEPFDDAGESLLVFVAEGTQVDMKVCAQLAGWADQPGMGMVAGALGGTQGDLLEAGMILSANGRLAPIFRDLSADFEGMGRREILPQNMLVPGRWFFAIRRDLWNQFGPISTGYETWTYRVGATALLLADEGFFNAMIPTLRLRYEDSFDEPESRHDRKRLFNRWPDLCARDPATNPNLNTEYGFFSIEQDRTIPINWRFEP
tara:strand:- start:7709 stop:9547 length:1839 start_codon:yes stop_codon:yes gene_type:complete